MNRRAFTLMEVLLAIGITAMLAGSIFSFLWNLQTQRQDLFEVAADLQSGNSIIESLERDILATIAGGPGVGAGINGSGSRLTLLSRGVSLPGIAQGATKSEFGDLQGAEYQFDIRSGELRARRWYAGESTRPTGEYTVISDRVQRFRLRYFNGRNWQTTFNSQSSGAGLPVAIEIALWFGEPQPPLDMIEQLPPMDQDPELLELESPEDLLPEEEPVEWKVREPDRLRIIVVPDGPVAAWRQST